MQIFAIAFNYFLKDRHIFATAAGNKISVYECLDPNDFEHAMKLIRVYSEPDKDEVFNAISWSSECLGPVLAAGGVKGIVRVIYCNEQPLTSYKNFVGHSKLSTISASTRVSFTKNLPAGAINDVKFHPTLPHLVLTCSKDYSIRLWNIRNSTCIAIFAGIRGHRDEVLSIDIAADGKKFISGGIDHNIMVWSLNSDDIKEKIAKCAEVEVYGRGNFTAVRLHFPEFSTRDVHGNYVDRFVFLLVRL